MEETERDRESGKAALHEEFADILHNDPRRKPLSLDRVRNARARGILVNIIQ